MMVLKYYRTPPEAVMRTAAEIIAQRFGPYYPDVDLGAILQDTTNVFKKKTKDGSLLLPPNYL